MKTKLLNKNLRNLYFKAFTQEPKRFKFKIICFYWSLTYLYSTDLFKSLNENQIYNGGQTHEQADIQTRHDYTPLGPLGPLQKELHVH